MIAGVRSKIHEINKNKIQLVVQKRVGWHDPCKSNGMKMNIKILVSYWRGRVSTVFDESRKCAVQ